MVKDKDKDVGLLSDIKRVRQGDFVLFYIEATTKVKGGFYGIFKIANQNPLVFHVSGSNGTQPNLGKKLIYRILLDPFEVYSKGVPEWEALDKLPVYSTEIQWSLIYRKLTVLNKHGASGCSILLYLSSFFFWIFSLNKNIFIFEGEKLFRKDFLKNSCF